MFDLAKLPHHACCTASHDFVSVAHIKMTVQSSGSSVEWFSGTSSESMVSLNENNSSYVHKHKLI